MSKAWYRNLGPGPLVAAAFIGPGTVTVCTLAGVNFSFGLLWALGLSVIATIVLQEMAARIGLVTGKGLASVVSDTLAKGPTKYLSLSLVLMAIVVGNAAYEAGNISGGAMGMELIWPLGGFQLGEIEINLLNFGLGATALLLLLSGSYRLVSGFLTLLVIIMSLCFLYCAWAVKPEWTKLMQGLSPSIEPNSIITVVALIGTTVVPYNLFLHSSLVAQKWKNLEDLKFVRLDTVLAVVLGGMVSMAIVITAAAGKATEVNSALDLAAGLEPALGAYAKYFMAFGLFAAGMTSAMTSPLAGALVICGVFKWDTRINSLSMRISMAGILGLGLLFSSLGIRPVQLITLAQLTNGILLPLLSAYILWLINKPSVMGGYSNSRLLNLLGILIWLITLILGSLSVAKVFGWIG